jgi:hypothetical protein
MTLVSVIADFDMKKDQMRLSSFAIFNLTEILSDSTQNQDQYLDEDLKMVEQILFYHAAAADGSICSQQSRIQSIGLAQTLNSFSTIFDSEAGPEAVSSHTTTTVWKSGLAMTALKRVEADYWFLLVTLKLADCNDDN